MYVVVLPPALIVDPARTAAHTTLVAARLGVPAGEAVTMSARIQERMVGDTPSTATVIDLLPTLTAAAHRAPMFFPRDWHLNAAGHAVAAARLERMLDRAP